MRAAGSLLQPSNNLAASFNLIAEYAYALDLFNTGITEFTVVGENKDEKSRELLEAAFSVHYPAKITKFEKPGHYPDLGKTVLFICSEEGCSSPVRNGCSVKEEANKFFSKRKIN